MTAVTTSASPANGRRNVVQGVPQAGAEDGTEMVFVPPGGTVPVPRPAAATQPYQSGSGHAGEPSKSAQAARVSGAPAPTSRTAATRLTPQVSPAETAARRDAADQGSPASATPDGHGSKSEPAVRISGLAGAGRGPRSGDPAPVAATVAEGVAEAFAVAYVEGLDGSERKILLHHIAQAFPGVVEAGAGLVEQWRAEAAEHRRKRLRRNDHDRRRRRRAEGGDNG